MRTWPKILFPLIALSFVAAAPPPATTTAPATTGPTATPFPAGTLVLPTYGLALTPPPASSFWAANLHPIPQDAAQWSIRDPITHILIADMRVSARMDHPPDQKSLTVLADSLNAKLLTQKFEIGHLPAFAIKKDSSSDGNPPQLRLIVAREGVVYTFLTIPNSDPTILGKTNPNHDLIALVKSVHWIPFGDPLDHVGDGQPDRIPILGRRATIALPPIFHLMVDTSNLTDQALVTFAVSDFRAGHSAVLMTAEFKPNPPTGIPWESLPPEQRPTLKTAGPETLDAGANPPLPNALATKLLNFSQMKGDKRDPTYQRFIEIYTNDGFIRIVSAIYSDDADIRGRWDKVLLQLSNSLQLAKPSSAGTVIDLTAPVSTSPPPNAPPPDAPPPDAPTPANPAPPTLIPIGPDDPKGFQPPP